MQTFRDYTIWDCGSETDALLRALNDMSREIEFAVNDVELGTESRHGYEAFFKLGDYKYFVRQMLIVMHGGTPGVARLQHVPGQMNAAPTFGMQPSPQILCAQERSSTIFGISINVFEYCEKDTAKSTFTVPQSAYIILCPSFWSTRVIPDYRYQRCPVIIDNRFKGGNYITRHGVSRTMEAERLTGLRRYDLLHEIIFYYLQRLSLSQDSTPPETFDWNECVELSAENSWRNPENWVLYIASQSWKHILVNTSRIPWSNLLI